MRFVRCDAWRFAVSNLTKSRSKRKGVYAAREAFFYDTGNPFQMSTRVVSINASFVERSKHSHGTNICKENSMILGQC